MDHTKYALHTVGYRIVCEKENDLKKYYFYEKYVTTKNKEDYEFNEWMQLVYNLAKKSFELDILETLIEFYEIKGWSNISKELAYEMYSIRKFKGDICPMTFTSLDLFHNMMDKKVEQLSLV